VCPESRKKTMTIRTILLCWLCGRATDLQVELYPGAALGSPRYWCSRCTSPRTFAKRLRERLASLESENTTMPEADVHLWNDLSMLLAYEVAFEGHREAALAA
jgi:hypothetical protein